MKDEIKCVVVGKSYLLETYITNIYPNHFIPTLFENYTKYVNFDGKTVKLLLTDTGGCEEYCHLRPLCYNKADICILCFSIDNPLSLERIKSRWIPEIHHYCPNIPIVLVGCKLDLRNNEKSTTFKEGREMASEIKALKYFECSALNRTNVMELFNEIISIIQKQFKSNASVSSCNVL
ncbi:hypothetical protein PVAND_009217 [Polypedilum vanderplanki]|uniref:Rho GTPase n=1 Tax=Polypedilum vanderplanki TaxID=319348 RepID=A0A9J6CDE8_POLVA|nr:hypothetical protein PVAND_009217 [Polypedilum vanderplanki]